MSNSKKCGKKERNNPPSCLIVGCGHFGSRAVLKLLQRDPASKITVIDKNRKALRKISHLPVEVHGEDGLLYLERSLKGGPMPDYVIPAVPFHLAFELILRRLKPLGAERGKVPPLPQLPNPMTGKRSDLYTSLAGFLCPEDCPEPSRYCTVTKRKRGKPLYEILMNLEGAFESRVIRSEQLGPGVGGFRLKALLDLIEDFKSKGTCARSFLISTACRCHGVTSALSFNPARGGRGTLRSNGMKPKISIKGGNRGNLSKRL